MKTVWGGTSTHFLSDTDKKYDLNFLKFEVKSTKAHAGVLVGLGILTEDEKNQIIIKLKKLSKNQPKALEYEDVHSLVEFKLGALGKKIHTYRSRNDLVSMNIRLFTLDKIEKITKLTDYLVEGLNKKSKQAKGIEISGFTHLQPAMTYSASGYLDCFTESLSDDLETESLIKVISKSTLGSGAGFGFKAKLPKSQYAKELGLKGSVKNDLYAVVSRPKVEKLYFQWLGNLSDSIEKFCSNLIFLNFIGAVKLPGWATSGSSIMPHKNNPDLLEVIRGKTKKIKAGLFAVSSIDSNLGLGYFRDFQETKPLLVDLSLELKALLEHLIKLVPELKFNSVTYPENQSVEDALKKVEKGQTWRDAYSELKD